MIIAPADSPSSDTEIAATIEFDFGGGHVHRSGAAFYFGLKIPLFAYQAAVDLYATAPPAGPCVYGAGVELGTFSAAYFAVTCARGDRFITLTGRFQRRMGGFVPAPDWAVGPQLAVGDHPWFFYLAYQHFGPIDVDNSSDSDRTSSQAVFVGAGLAWH